MSQAKAWRINYSPPALAGGRITMKLPAQLPQLPQTQNNLPNTSLRTRPAPDETYVSNSGTFVLAFALPVVVLLL